MDIHTESIGERIKKRRVQLGLTQTDIYKKCGISSGSLSNIENGLRLPSCIILYKLSKVLDCDMNYLITGETYNQENTNSFHCGAPCETLPQEHSSLLEADSDKIREDTINMNTIGMRIKQRRTELHITQTSIQEACGISSGNISGIETGRYLPSAITLIELSKFLDCSIDWILTGKSFISTIEDSSDKQILLNLYHSMSPDDQQELLMIAQMKYNKTKSGRSAKSFLSGSNDSGSDTA